MPRAGNILNVRASQVLLITADYHGKAILLFAIVMTSRKSGLYRKVWRLLKDKVPRFRPPMMMMDYERALRTSFKFVFPATRLYGCR